MRAEVITDLDALTALEPAWWDLFARVPDATPFASPAWLLPWWCSFAPGRLFVVVMSDNGRLAGLAPLYTEDGPQGARLLPLGIGVTDLVDILIAPEAAGAAGVALGAVLREARTQWRCWSAEDAPPGAAVLALADPPDWRSHVAPQCACPVLALPASRELRETIPPRKWRKWQMARNRAGRRTASIAPTTPDTLPEDLAHLVRLHGARWQGRGETGVLADAAVRRFHATAAPALLATGLLQMLTLRIDGVVAGVYYGLRRGFFAAAYLGGFDPAFAFESPGTLLLGAAIEAAVQEGASAFSFLRGQEPYKYEWGAVDVWSQRRTFEPVA